MQELYSEIEINAPAETVWNVLTDFERYPEWHPTFKSIEGDLKPGARLEFEGAIGAGGRTMTIRPTLLVVEPNRELRWLGRIVAPGIFDGEHRFQIEVIDDGKVRFVQAERFRGVLVPLLMAMIGKQTQADFEATNRALKARAESMAPAAQ